MSAPAAGQPAEFAFTPENVERAKAFIDRYPRGRQKSAVMPLLDLAQRQTGGWLPPAAIDHVADYLGMPAIRVFEVATFYTMYHLEPVGKHVVGVCTTTPCWLRGSDEVLDACREVLGIGVGETTGDSRFTLTELECLGACCNAPVIRVDDDYYEDLDADATRRMLEAFKRGEKPAPGSSIGRRSSEPVTGLTTLQAAQPQQEP